MTGVSVTELQDALARGDHDRVLRLTDAVLAERPGDDAAHELRARALLALGRLDEAELHADDAVRLDPDEVRYRELLAEVLSRRGAHRDAAAEFGRLARNDPRQSAWTLAEAQERLGAAQPEMSVEAARRAVKLDARSAPAQLALSRALARIGDARGALQAATLAVELLPGEPAPAEALADAWWLADRDAAAEFGRLARNDPRQSAWTLAEARERLGAAQPEMSVEAARRGVKLDARNAPAQLALSRALARIGDARGALQAATLAVELLPGDPAAAEALADAWWLADRDAAAFAAYRSLALELHGDDRRRVTQKARTLYHQRAGAIGRALAGLRPLFGLAFRNGWIAVAEEGSP